MAKSAQQQLDQPEDGDRLPKGFTLIRRTALTHTHCKTMNVVEALDRLQVTCLFCTYCSNILHPMHTTGERR